MKNILLLGRIQFLVYSPIAFALGTVFATYQTGGFDPFGFIWGQIIVSIIHLMTHYFNEYYDLDTDSVNDNASPWTGGSKILANNLIRPIVSWRVGVFLAIIASCLIILLMETTATRVVCFMGLLLAWGYSAPPLRLSRRGLGELVTAVCLNLLGPVLGYLIQVQDSPLSWDKFSILLLLLLPLTLIQYIRMIVMNIPDRFADAQVGKKTLVVRVGIQKVSIAHMAGMILAYSIGGCMIFFDIGIPVEVLLMFLLSAPLGVMTTIRVWQYKREQDEKAFFTVPFWATTHMAWCVLLTLLGFVIVHPEEVLSPITHLKYFSVYLYVTVMLYFYLKKTIGNKLKMEGTNVT